MFIFETRRAKKMKKYLLVILVVTLGLILIQPTVSNARTVIGNYVAGYHQPGGGYHGGHPYLGGGYPYYRGWYPYYRGWYPYYWGYGSWYGPWYFPSWYISVAPTIYATPAPAVYSDYSQQQPYANPDPAFIEKYGRSDVSNTPGEWVIVPGQYVNGIWVREHKVWVQGSR